MARLTIVQKNDTHAYFDLHQEIFWKVDQVDYGRPEDTPLSPQ